MTVDTVCHRLHFFNILLYSSHMERGRPQGDQMIPTPTEENIVLSELSRDQAELMELNQQSNNLGEHIAAMQMYKLGEQTVDLQMRKTAIDVRREELIMKIAQNRARVDQRRDETPPTIDPS
jgi:hypothetical protein